jgi:hypothetical protein
MFDPQSTSAKREIYFHEDDFCQQELLPREGLAYAEAEIKRIDEFADAHRTPGGFGWTKLHIRQNAPVSFRALGIKKEELDAVISPHLAPFDLVYTGYSSYRERCKKTGAWGTAQHNAIFADWDEEDIITNVWTQLFESDEKSLLAATKAVGALGMLHSIIYVDWAWGYTCEIISDESLASALRAKLAEIAESAKEIKEDGDTES